MEQVLHYTPKNESYVNMFSFLCFNVCVNIGWYY